jgi:hypothetical protein
VGLQVQEEKYLDELSDLDPSPVDYVLEQNKALLKAQAKQIKQGLQSSMPGVNWKKVFDVTPYVIGGAVAVGLGVAVYCEQEGCGSE